ncbi:hypothetical protein PVAP13_6NG226706 [Panicum virgatum]|uniref:Uncharacterized protein n=1 Tax=Panicum virgatum TaxID=38727 RepID=A0A8T0QZ38_PANVG|nr:hypothetical protein PVAP13_6NG226706 [Panicum virgatum]
MQALRESSARRQFVPMVRISIFRCAGPFQSGSHGMRRRYKPRSGGTLTYIIIRQVIMSSLCIPYAAATMQLF